MLNFLGDALQGLALCCFVIVGCRGNFYCLQLKVLVTLFKVLCSFPYAIVHRESVNFIDQVHNSISNCYMRNFSVNFVESLWSNDGIG